MTELKKNLIINITGAIAITLITHFTLKKFKESNSKKIKENTN